MRCLHCGKRLSLLRKFSDAEFCSDEHRLEFQQQQSDLALARLIESQNRIQKPLAPAKSLAPPKPSRKKKVAETEPVIPMARTVFEHLSPLAARSLHIPALVVETQPGDLCLPSLDLPLDRRGFGSPGSLSLAAPLPAAAPTLHTVPTRALFRLALKLRARDLPAADPCPRPAARLLPLQAGFFNQRLAPGSPIVSSAAPPLASPALPSARLAADRIEIQPPAPPPEALPAVARALPVALPGPARFSVPWHCAANPLSPDRTPAAPPLPRPTLEAGARPGALVALPQSPAHSSRAQFATHTPLELAAEPRLPAPPPPLAARAALRTFNASARLGLKAMAASAGIAAPASAPAVIQAEPALPAFTAAPALPGFLSPSLPLTLQASAAACAALPWLTGLLDAARDAAYPRSPFRPLPPEPAASQPEEEDAPPLQRSLPVLLSRPADCVRPAPLSANPVMALADWPDPRMPGCRLDIDQADGSGPRRTRQTESVHRRPPFFSFDAQRLPGSRFWRHAPADLKWVALGLPLLLVVVLYSFRPSSPKPLPANEEIASAAPASQTVIGGQLNAVQKVILNRAAVKLYDDFRGGLGAWNGDENWSKTWKYGAASFLEPGDLALYSPSLGMRDYTFQFLGQIGRKSLNWVFRAEDTKNYYSMRIVITRGGPLPEAHLVRSVVIDGKERDVKSLPIPFPVRQDTLYLVRMDVRGADFTTYIQGQVVDTFTDTRLERGGVGFYSARGDQSLLRWVELTHQYDFLGRLCALVTPYEITAQGRQAN